MSYKKTMALLGVWALLLSMNADVLVGDIVPIAPKNDSNKIVDNGLDLVKKESPKQPSPEDAYPTRLLNFSNSPWQTQLASWSTDVPDQTNTPEPAPAETPSLRSASKAFFEDALLAPEPSSLHLIAAGVMYFACRRRRRSIG